MGIGSGLPRIQIVTLSLFPCYLGSVRHFSLTSTCGSEFEKMRAGSLGVKSFQLATMAIGVALVKPDL